MFLAHGLKTMLVIWHMICGLFWYILCNVPTLGHIYITECYDDQSIQMEVIASTGAIEGFLGSVLHRSSYFTIMIHFSQLGFGFAAFPRFS
jgi:hypothetical protein